MNARARPWWLLPFALNACAAEPVIASDAGMFEAGVRDHDEYDDDAGEWRPPPPTYAPTFDAIFNEVFEQRLCTSVFCHGLGGATLNFSSIDAGYASLVNHVATGADCKDMGLVIVVPGDPDASLLVSKVSSDTPACGERMPRAYGVTLDERQITQIREWIALGAPRYASDAGLDASF